MLQSISYSPFNYRDKEIVRAACYKRCIGVLKTFSFSFLLPFGVIGAIIYANNLSSQPLDDAHGYMYYMQHPVWQASTLKAFMFLLFGAFLMLVANVYVFFSMASPIIGDLLRGQKKVYNFKPEPYYIPGDDDFYIKTGIPEHAFLKVDFGAYSRAEETQVLVLEVTPNTRIILNIYPQNDTEHQTTSLL